MAADCPPAAAQPAQLRSNRDQTWRPSDGLVFADRRCMTTEDSRPAAASGATQTSTASGSPSRRALHSGAPRSSNNNCNTNTPTTAAAAADPKLNNSQTEDDVSIAREFASLSLGSSSHTTSASPSYYMTRETHSDAKRNGRYWCYDFYKNSKGKKPKLHYCRKIDRSEEVARLFLDEKVIGFDIEWSPVTFYRSNKGSNATDSIKHNVSVIQVASESRIAVFQLALHVGTTADQLLAPSLRQIMESRDIAKVGVHINADCTRIGKFLGTYVNSRIELSHIHNLVSHFNTDPSKINRKAVALHTLVQQHLGLPLCKDEVRTSHWDRELEWSQLQYAASDAYAGLQVYHALNNKRLALDPVPPIPAYAELKLPIRLVDDATDETEGNDAGLEQVQNTSIDHDYKP